ncbi:LacI family DNA-binding transcriptional regulator [Microlunatus soli]|uniref:DNA-binding transcriptional regulator, LacI/PurR family n=1 Tax=Microlunatus soli TaxID=630515 RepID=A0A1H1Z1Y6_9ACTN|nr:LacI family DNA-binding transcriptional regulator [Microlunatus soli]SDT27688.1 DNA-binding transcriptional regulator, LacI/PurR family [Microlunatus soli]
MSTPRLTDVAVRAGVSMKTVSNVVNGTGSASEATRARVRAAIEELGYRPNVTARRLATGQTGTISVAVSSVTVAYFAELSNRLDQAARKQNLRVVIEQTHGARTNELAILQERERGLVDGVIFHPVSLTPEDLAGQRPGFPLVLLGEGPAPATVDHVMIDNVAAATEITRHLIERGCRRIAFLGAERSGLTHTTGQRFDGYRTALRTAGLRPDPRLRLTVDHYSADNGFRVVTAALEAGIGFDAIVCRDDALAAGALHALHTRGLAVPADVAVAGWDNLIISRHLWPPLTSVEPDKTAIAETALRLLHDRIGGYEGPGRHEIVAAQLLERDSTDR